MGMRCVHHAVIRYISYYTEGLIYIIPVNQTKTCENMIDCSAFDELYSIYESIKPEIIARLAEFRELKDRGSEEDIFKELVFCLLTPQSRAELCWTAVENLAKRNLLLTGDRESIANSLTGVRFKATKAQYIVEARRKFVVNGEIRLKSRLCGFNDVSDARDWLVREVRGIGYKEASHLLRNIGLGTDLAILDRHILKNLKLLGVIEETPASLSRRRYLELERALKHFSERIHIPLSHMDFVLWYKETGIVFK